MKAEAPCNSPLSRVIRNLTPPLRRPRSHLARDTVLEAAWICTNLACTGEAAAAAVLAAAPVLALHLDCAHGYAVAEQCAWALGESPRFALPH